MKKFLFSMWVFIGLAIEYAASKIGVIKTIDMLDMPRFSDGDNMGGTGTVFYYALAEDVDAWPSLPDWGDATDLDDLMVLTGDLTMKTGKCFFTGYMTQDTGQVSSNDQGEVDGISQKHTLKFFHPRISDKLNAFIRATNNKPMVFIVPDSNGQNLMFGSEKFPAIKDPSGESGTGEGTAGRGGATLQFVSAGNGPVPILPDTIAVPLTPAT